jgi:CubicO group peptidase (beta-lactamase class C family)
MSLVRLSQLFTAVTSRFSGSSGRVSEEKLSKLLGIAARKFNVPGIAVGVFSDGKVTFSSYGVTDINNPAPVDENTLFVIASVTKTFTATAIMRLVANEKVDLDAPVKRYIPEFKLQDQAAAEQNSRITNYGAQSPEPYLRPGVEIRC